MSFQIKLGNEEEPFWPVLATVPRYIEAFLNKNYSNVDIENTDDDMAKQYHDFEKEMNELRCTYLKKYGYRYIKVSENGKLKNPFYFHIPGKPDSAISFDESEDRVRFTRISLEEAIASMSPHDILVNEVLGDKAELRGIPSYDARLPEIDTQLSDYNKYADKVNSEILG